ncbi:MAG: glycosyltransferase family 39 protein [Bacteroidetes bacterium]|nr:glycosyltransferase family 39 protein [Bacteroidota bacterium]MCL2302158.1 glycosyltransferase family 39 protein [Lentimicrobiaceae bacterium]
MFKTILKDSWKYLLLLLLVCFPLFLHLDALTIRLWDESRLAINAYEMYHNGGYLIPTFDEAPDMWNTKPPLMIWLQVFFMKIFGVNEWAIRLPSALAALFTCAILMLISVRYLKKFWFGFICILVLVTSRGYVGYHAARTGDYDALLTLFLTLGSFSFFAFIENSKAKYLYLFFISMAFAVLTKSSAALMILPGFFIYTVIQKKLLFVLKNKHFYIGLLLFIICAGSYYVMREMYNPGYLKAVIENEFGGRFFDTIEHHKRGFWFYFGNLFDHRFIIWVLFLPIGIYKGLTNKDSRIKKLTLFSSVTALTYFLVISSAQTKLSWYVVPMYPFLALLVGVCIFHIFSWIKEKTKLKYKALPYIFLVIIFITPYSLIISAITKPKKYPWFEDKNEITYYLKYVLQGKIQNDNFTVIYDGMFTHGKFYMNLLHEQGKSILVKKRDGIKTGEVVLISQDEVKKFLDENFEYITLEQFHKIGLYEIVAEK